MKFTFYLLLCFTVCARVLSQTSAGTRPEFKVSVQKEHWHTVGGIRSLRLIATVKNISEHRLQYLSTGLSAHLFQSDTSAVFVVYGPGHHKTDFEFLSLAADSSRQFPVDIAFAKTAGKTVNFRLGFIWIMPQGQILQDILRSTTDNPPDHKMFWSDTLTITQ